MNRGWIAIGMIGALGLGFGLGRMGEPPRELPSEREDKVTPREMSVKDTGEGLEFSALSEDELFVVGFGDNPRRWRPVPPGPDSVNVPKKDLGDLWGVIGTRAKPCHCTPVDPPPGMLQDFLTQMQRMVSFCEACEQAQSSCQEDEVTEIQKRECELCSSVCG